MGYEGKHPSWMVNCGQCSNLTFSLESKDEHSIEITCNDCGRRLEFILDGSESGVDCAICDDDEWNLLYYEEGKHIFIENENCGEVAEIWIKEIKGLTSMGYDEFSVKVVEETVELIKENGPHGVHDLAEGLCDQGRVYREAGGSRYDMSHENLQEILERGVEFTQDDSGRWHLTDKAAAHDI